MAAEKTVDRFFAKAAPDVGTTVADLLSRAAGPGPRASDLVSLVDLAALLIQAPGGDGLTRGQAERELLHAVLGEGEWAGRAPSCLAVYCPWGTGYLELDDEVNSFTWCAGQSLRAGQLRWLWSRHIEGVSLANIDPSPGLGIRSLAVLRAPALAAFGLQEHAEQSGEVYGAGAAAESRPLAENGSRTAGLVQPEGGKWPHVDGQAWTDAERMALFLMRHREGWTGEALATVAGVKRQRIDELIGPAKPHGGVSKAKGKDGWQPSAELLAACGQTLQPLQRAALSMAS